MNVFVAEDEPPARERLIETLARAVPQARVVGTADSVVQTRRWLAGHAPPDVLLLDIQLADGLSLELFRDGACSLPTVFTTAYDEFALAAFQALAVDYLLKPVSDEALARAFARLARLRTAFGVPAAQALAQALSGPGAPPTGPAAPSATASTAWRQRWVARQGAGFATVASEQVAWFVSLDKLTFAIARDGTRHLLEETLAAVEAAADPARFFRVNRQMIVAIDAVRRFVPEGKGRLALELSPPPGVPVSVSQERAAAFRAWLDR